MSGLLGSREVEVMSLEVGEGQGWVLLCGKLPVGCLESQGGIPFHTERLSSGSVWRIVTEAALSSVRRVEGRTKVWIRACSCQSSELSRCCQSASPEAVAPFVRVDPLRLRRDAIKLSLHLTSIHPCRLIARTAFPHRVQAFAIHQRILLRT